MIVFGIGEVVASEFMKRIISKCSTRSLIFLVMTIIVFSCGYTTAVHTRQNFDYLWFGAAFLWGISDSMINNTLNTI